MQTAELDFVRCVQKNGSVALFRPDAQGRGVYVFCKWHRREELQSWVKLGLTREIAERFLKEPESHD